MRETFFVPDGVIIAIVCWSTANQTGRVTGVPSRRRVVNIPVCDAAITSHASVGVNRMPMSATLQ